MNFVGNGIFMLVTSAASLPCNNNDALNTSWSRKALESQNHRIAEWLGLEGTSLFFFSSFLFNKRHKDPKRI